MIRALHCPRRAAADAALARLERLVAHARRELPPTLSEAQAVDLQRVVIAAEADLRRACGGER